MANRGLLQAAGSWSADACCAVPGNTCDDNSHCWDHASSSDWLFGLWPSPPQRFEPTGADTDYQHVAADWWPVWGGGSDLDIGGSGAPGGSTGYCDDRTSSSDWLFGLWPGPPQRFEPTGADTDYQFVEAYEWPIWGYYGGGDLAIGDTSGAPGVRGSCSQGTTYRGTSGEICGGNENWGATDVEVWYPRDH